MSKAVVVRESDIGKYLQDISSNLSGYAMRNYNTEGFLKSVMLAIVESKELTDALKTPGGKSTLYQALRFAASTGLSLNPQEGKAALIAYSGKITYQIMKSGMIELAMQSGKVDFITSDTVRESDNFSIEKTMDGDRYSFIPARKDRGEIDGFFAAIRLTTGAVHVKYMTKKEVEDHRDSFSSYFKAKKSGPWKTSFEGMGLKTVLKALFRGLNIAPEIDAAVNNDDAEISSFPNMQDVTPDEPGTTSDEVKEEIKEAKKTPVPIPDDPDEPGPGLF